MLKLALLFISSIANAAYNPVPNAIPCTAISATSIDWTTSNCFTQSNGATNRTYTFTTPSIGQTIVVRLTQSTGTPTWPTSPSLKWPSNTTPSRTVNGTDIYTLFFDGTTTYGSAVLDFR